MDRQERLRIAVQKSGRLTDESLDLLHRCALGQQSQFELDRKCFPRLRRDHLRAENARIGFELP